MTTLTAERDIRVVKNPEYESYTESNMQTTQNFQYEDVEIDFDDFLFLLSDKIIKKISFKDLSKGYITQFQKFAAELAINNIYNAIEQERAFLEDEEIELPNQKVIDSVKEFITILSIDNLYPDEITTTVEEGLCLIFKSKNQKLYLEFYNDGDIGYIIEDTETKKLLENQDIFSLSEIKNRIIKFFD